MLLEQRLGRSPRFFLLNEGGGCYSLCLASQRKSNAQKAPGLPSVRFLAKKELGFCGSQGADHISLTSRKHWG